jgi:arginine decarboxylase
MQSKYVDLINQSFDFPQEEFSVKDNELFFHEISLMELIKQYGTPLKVSYLPKISTQIQKAKRWFNVAIAKADYKGTYSYCYCTKSSHFSFVLNEALKNDIHIETSSAFDIPIIKNLFQNKKISKDTFIICNGYKRPLYTQYITELINEGFRNVIPILDNKMELDYYERHVKNAVNVGIRIAAQEEPGNEFYTSRLGINYKDIKSYYIDRIKGHKKINLKMLHFFINTGIRDTSYYWSELTKCINVYCELKKVCPTIDSLDIGGGLPIKTSLAFNYDYEYMIEQIVMHIKKVCDESGVAEPNIFTEFGSYTVGESGAVLYSIVDQKHQNDNEIWNMIDSSFITTLPDTWGIKQKFVLLAINNWGNDYERVNLGGLTCDGEDYYNTESEDNQIFLPKLIKGDTQYIGFFHTGAYQENIGGYGGVQHCLIPAPKHVIIYKDEEDNEIYTKLFAKEQSYKSMLKILGY